MSHDPERIAQLLDAVAGLPNTDRNAFLETACGGDHELRRLIEELLSTREFTASSLETPTAIQSGFENHELATAAYVADPDATITGPEAQAAAETLIADPTPSVSQTEATSKAASQVVIAGRYALVELLGQGGMGEVWVAQQSEPVKRRVALKLIKGGMDSRDVVNRFEAERQALAMMDHPCIARILDGGLTESRLPFFVMELVDGQPLSKYCDAARLTIRQRLELFVSICKGVQHAHQKGIVHRDLKPGNILVGVADGHPVPKVIDFGLAKATQGKLTEETMATTYGAVVGTLDYMSPEQAGLSGGDVDTRSDIYSLGVILYELLTGLRPIESKQFKPGGLTEVLRKIQQDEPPRPSARLATSPKLVQLAAARQAEPRQLTALLRGELDWVVMKCLEKQRDRRYETVNALARDVERYLADEPVEARPPNAKYRIGKFLQRNKGPVIAASLVFLALVGGIIGTAIGLVRAMRAEEVLADEARRADDARKEAERQLAHGLIAQGDALSLASRIPEAYARYNEAYDKFVELKEPLLVPEAALWDLAERNGLPLLRTEILESVSCIEITPDNRTALIGTDGGALWSWDLASGRRLRVFDGHTGWIWPAEGQSALS
ncbi:MAG: serine/threonine-protein kinase [Planctomycetota bacterium]|nr:serine/threonine-protein kinase [Planctomycetota bacterium]